MRRSQSVMLLAALGAAAIFASCSKQAASPMQPPACSINPTAIAFGSVNVGFSADRQLTVTNTGGGTLSGSVTEACATFQVVGSGSYSLAAGQSAVFTLRFAPTAASTYSCAVGVGSCGLTATGTGSIPVGSCRVTPTNLDFGTVLVGQTVDRVFRIVNTGASVLAGTIDGSCDSYSIAGRSTYSLSSGDSASFIVRLSPTHGGSLGCTVTTGSGACSNVNCTALAEEVCSVSPTSVDFGVATVGQSKDTTFTVRNVGSGSLVGSVGLASSCDAFSLVGGSSYNLGAGQSATFTLRFHPTIGAGLYSCTVLTGSGCADISCSGEAHFPQQVANCLVSPTALAFGDVIVGQSATQIFQIRNGYSAGGPQLSGVVAVSGAGFFAPTQTYIINPGQTWNVPVAFTPGTLGPATGAATITQTGCSYCGASCSSVTLTGNGITAPPPAICAVSSDNLFLGTYYFGQVKDTTFTLSNTGGGTMSGSVSFLDAVPAPFSLVGPTRYAIAASQSQSFTVRFAAPTVQPGHTDSYARTIDLGTACAAVSPLTVQAIAIPVPPMCLLVPDTLDFGTVPVGQSKDLILTIRNVGGGFLGGSLLGCGNFTFVGATSYSLGAGQTASFTVRLTPNGTGLNQCYVSTGFTCAPLVARGTGS